VARFEVRGSRFEVESSRLKAGELSGCGVDGDSAAQRVTIAVGFRAEASEFNVGMNADLLGGKVRADWGV
jgi:hypothetical protein